VLEILASPEAVATVLSVKLGKLPPHEKKAIRFYVKSGYVPINTHLRNGGCVDQSKAAQNLKASMASLPNHKGVVYRSVKMEDTSKLVVGAIFRDEGFLSASMKGPEIFFKFAVNSNVDFTIQSGTGKDISSISQQKEEYEVLFLPGTRFIITKVYQDDGKVKVEMTEITKELQEALQEATVAKTMTGSVDNDVGQVKVELNNAKNHESIAETVAETMTGSVDKDVGQVKVELDNAKNHESIAETVAKTMTGSVDNDVDQVKVELENAKNHESIVTVVETMTEKHGKN
jgi:ADP-ribosyltransferase exoenzyme